MKRDNQRKPNGKLLVSVQKIRRLDATGLKKANGGACPTSKPVSKTGG